MITPTIKLVAFEDRDPDFIFVGVPDARGRYLRTDKSVVFAECEQCRAAIGEPCRSGAGDGYNGTTHVVRRTAAQRYHRGRRGEDVLQVELAADGRLA